MNIDWNQPTYEISVSVFYIPKQEGYLYILIACVSLGHFLLSKVIGVCDW
jgi:hypothetical protein